MSKIKHFIEIGGVECVGLGTDFDGITGEFEIGEPEKMELLFEQLHREGSQRNQTPSLLIKIF